MALCVHKLSAGWQVTMIDCMGGYSNEYWSAVEACRRCERECGCLKQSQLVNWVYIKDSCVAGYESTAIAGVAPFGGGGFNQRPQAWPAIS